MVYISVGESNIQCEHKTSNDINTKVTMMSYNIYFKKEISPMIIIHMLMIKKYKAIYQHE